MVQAVQTWIEVSWTVRFGVAGRVCLSLPSRHRLWRLGIGQGTASIWDGCTAHAKTHFG